MVEPTLRETLEASFKDAGDAPSNAPAESQVAGAGEHTEPPADLPADTTGAADRTPSESVGGPVESKLPVEKPAESGEPSTVSTEQNQPAQPQAAADIRTPTSWRPEMRDAFKTLPEPVQKEILRREDDVRRFVQETAGYRKYIEDFENVCAPYRQLIAMEGNDPLKAFGDYLRTASVLRIGTPVEKANALASAVKQFGIDVQLLDTSLAAVFNGQQMPQQGNGANGQQYRDPRVDQLVSALEQSQATRAQELETRQIAEIEAFRQDPKNEFFEDLRKDIADLLDFNANRGVRMTIQQAYDMAAQMHPEVSKVFAQRKAHAQAVANQRLIAEKRKAVVGVPGAPDVGVVAKQSDSLRGAIEAAMNQHQQPV